VNIVVVVTTVLTRLKQYTARNITVQRPSDFLSANFDFSDTIFYRLGFLFQKKFVRKTKRDLMKNTTPIDVVRIRQKTVTGRIPRVNGTRNTVASLKLVNSKNNRRVATCREGSTSSKECRIGDSVLREANEKTLFHVKNIEKKRETSPKSRTISF